MPSREYTPEQLQAMQQEAVARVREMQRRARARLEGRPEPVKPAEHTSEEPPPASPPPIPSLSPPVPPRQTQNIPEQQAIPAMQSGLGAPSLSPLSGLLGMLGGDSDRITLLLLMLMLSTDGQCSPSLMAALFWLMTP